MASVRGAVETRVLAGTPYEIGLQHGRAAADLIRTISAANLRSVVDLARVQGGPSISAGDVRALMAGYVPILEEHVPCLMEEVKGIATGSGVPIDDVLSLNAFLDIFDLTFPHLADRVLAGGGCSTFGIQGAPGSEVAYLGQNYDVRQFFEPGVFIADVRPAGAPRALVPTIAGMVGCAGLNEAGVGVAINNLTPTDSRLGVLHQFVVREILRQERIGDAVNAVTSLPRASGYNYLIGDRSGELIGIESSATRHAVYYPEPAGYACHCNHYAVPHMLDVEGAPATSGDSIARHGRMRHHLIAMRRAQPLEELQRICADHTNHPYSICRHSLGEAAYPLGQGKTVFSVIFDLTATSMSFCQGNPCTGSYESYAVA